MSISPVADGLKYNAAYQDEATKSVQCIVIFSAQLAIFANGTILSLDDNDYDMPILQKDIMTAEQAAFLKLNEDFKNDYYVRGSDIANPVVDGSKDGYSLCMTSLEYAKKYEKYREIQKNSVTTVSIPQKFIDEIKKTDIKNSEHISRLINDSGLFNH